MMTEDDIDDFIVQQKKRLANEREVRCVVFTSLCFFFPSLIEVTILLIFIACASL